MARIDKNKIRQKVGRVLGGIFTKVQKLPLTISFLLFAVGLSWLFILPSDQYIKYIYISENALLPSSAYAYYSPSKVRYAEDQSKILRQLKLKGSQYYSDHLVSEFQALGIETAQQKFVIKSEDGLEDIEGINTYAILRAWKSDGTEALLLNADWESLPSGQGNHNGVAMLLSMAHQFKQSTFWAKDVIFLFTQHHHQGLHQWLSRYHGEDGTQPLGLRSGDIQIAVELDLPPTSNHYESIQIIYEGLNGQLPNLDVITTLQKVGEDFRAKTSVHPYPHLDGYLSRLACMFTQLGLQATTLPTKPSGLFLAYDIHGVTLAGVPAPSSDFGWMEIGILIEEAFRSYNNLLERLHHSYNFYIMLSYDQFVSLQMYLPVVGIFGAIPLLYSMIVLSSLHLKFPQLKPRTTLGFYHYVTPFVIFFISQVMGWQAFLLMTRYTDKLNNLGIFIIPVVYAIQAKFLPLITPLNSVSFFESQLMRLIITSVAILCLTTLNFGLALALSLLTLPYVVIAHFTPIRSIIIRLLTAVLIIAISPPVLMIIAALVLKQDVTDMIALINWNIQHGNSWIGWVVGLIYFPLNFGYLQAVLASDKV